MVNTTWSATDKTANLTLTGGNLIATSSSAGTNQVRAAHCQYLGKFYWECTFNTVAGTNSGPALYSALSLSSIATGFAVGAATGTCGFTKGGVVYLDGSATGTDVGALVNGSLACIAVDLTARLAWFRIGAAGLWNNSASGDPATGTVGISILSLGNGIPVYPAVCLAGLNEQATAKFGDTAFTGTVPSGFTAGWTTAAAVVTNDLVTQSALEHFYATNPDNQTTQTALEMWATTATITGQNLVTQVALEMWAPSAPAIVPQARVMILS
jgi:hypothetical protein